MVQDEGRFGRVNILRGCWAPKQVRPVVAKQVVRESFYVYAGICTNVRSWGALALKYYPMQIQKFILFYTRNNGNS